MFQGLSGTAYIYQKGEKPNDTARRVSIGSVHDLSQIVGDDQCDVIGGATFMRQTPRETRYEYSGVGIGYWDVPGGSANPALSSIEISSDLIEDYGIDTCLKIAKLHTELADQSGAAYGLIDFAPSTEIVGGAIFGRVVYPAISLVRIVEKSKWEQYGWLSRRARGLYWGNYLNNEMLSRLPSDFLSCYAELSRDVGGWEQAHVWRMKNGAFF